MNKRMVSSVAIALFLLAGCAASGPKLASSFEDIAGTWHSITSSAEIQFNEDGTVRRRTAEQTPEDDAGFRFEGTRLILTDTPGRGCTLIGAEIGIYEVELLENGNLKFATIEDECATRLNYLEGALIEAEWEPVP